MFDETNKTEENEITFPETLFGDENEPSADIQEEKNVETEEAEVEKNGENPQESTTESFGDTEVSAARAREQIARISESVGLSGAWGNLFKKYPSLSRSEASAELSEAVKSGLTPLEAYQQKLISEQERELRAIRQNEEASRRSVGSLGSDAGATTRDDFLEGFFIED